MNIKKSPLMAGLLSLSAVFGSMAAKGYEGEIGVKEGCFDNAPVDKVLGVSNGFVWTYRSQAKYTYQKPRTVEIDGVTYPHPAGGIEVVTNSAPFVRVSMNGQTGFASGSGIMPGVNESALVNKKTGVIASVDENGNVTVSTPAGNGLGGYSTATYQLYAEEHGTTPAHLTGPLVSYMYDDSRMIIFGKNTSNPNVGAVTRVAKSESGDRFVVTKQNGREHAPYVPTMADQSAEKVYFSDGTSIISFDAQNGKNPNRTEIVQGTVVKNMAVAGGKVFWTTGTELYCEGTPSVFNLNGAQMTDLVSDGTTLYVGNTNGVSYATSLGGVSVQYVDKAAQLISSKENNQTLIYRMYQNQVERVK